jgi:hypothetical protein
MLVNKSKKIPELFECKNCKYNTSSKKDFKKHTETLKHKRLVNASDMLVEKTNHNIFVCCCGKSYHHDSSYYRHKKKCHVTDENSTNAIANETMNDKELIQYLMKENSEFKNFMFTSLQEQNKQMIELSCNLVKNVGNNNNNTTSNVVNNNQQFNLNFYLNETCKNAMNIMDFVSQLQVSIKDLEETGRLGYAEGISKIFINGLKQMSVTDRPIHCSDLKRETLYIKDNNEWNKDSEDKTILTNAIKHVSHKNMKQISEWTKIHPTYKDSDSKENDKYLKIVSESMSGTTADESKKNYSKIVKNIVKETVIDKTVDSV